MGDVADVGEVEEVLVVADLDVGLAATVGAEQSREQLGVALAEDARGANGTSEELGGLFAVGLEDELFSSGLCVARN